MAIGFHNSFDSHLYEFSSRFLGNLQHSFLLNLYLRSIMWSCDLFYYVCTCSLAISTPHESDSEWYTEATQSHSGSDDDCDTEQDTVVR